MKNNCPAWPYRIEKPCMVIEKKQCRYLITPPEKMCENCRKRYAQRGGSLGRDTPLLKAQRDKSDPWKGEIG